MADNTNEFSVTPVLDKLLEIDEHIMDLNNDVFDTVDDYKNFYEKIKNTIEDFKIKMDKVSNQIVNLDLEFDEDTIDKISDNHKLLEKISLKVDSYNSLPLLDRIQSNRVLLENISSKVNDKSRIEMIQNLLLGISNSLEYQKKDLKDLNLAENIEKIIEKNIILENILNKIYILLNNKNNLENNEEIIKNFISLKTAIDKIGYAVNEKSIETGILEKLNVIQRSISSMNSAPQLDYSENFNRIDSVLAKINNQLKSDEYVKTSDLTDAYLTLKSGIDQIKVSVNDKTLVDKIGSIETSLTSLNRGVKEVINNGNNEKILAILDAFDRTLTKNAVNNKNYYDAVKNDIGTLTDYLIQHVGDDISNWNETKEMFSLVYKRQNDIEDNFIDEIHGVNEKINKLNNNLENILLYLKNISEKNDTIIEKIKVVEENTSATEFFDFDECETEEDDFDDAEVTLEDVYLKLDELNNAINRLLDAYLATIGEG